LTFLQLLIGRSPIYVTILGFVGLGIEATLPIPQFISHYRNKSVAGFRPSVIIAWLLGDMFKTSYFFFGDANVTWQFKACAVVQISFDLGIAVQFCLYGDRYPWNANGNAAKHIEELEEGVLRRQTMPYEE
jgi:solute carrier family 66, member 2